jgi:hypothetical protein
MCQALLKQLRPDVSVTYSSTDIIAEFNSNVNWFFRNGAIMTSLQTDFEYVSAHELVHGMGFGTGYLEYSQIYSGSKTGYIAPNMIGANADATTATLFRAMEPIDIFDSFVPALNSAGEIIANFPIQSSTYLTFISSFERSGNPFNAARDVYQASLNPLSFEVGDTKINLFTPTTFQQGSSLSHVPLSQANGPEFLMIPQLRPGVNMDTLIGTGGLFGPGIMKVMESIGWPTNNASIAQTITMGSNYGTGPVGSLPSSGIRLKPLLWFFLLCFTSL